MSLYNVVRKSSVTLMGRPVMRLTSMVPRALCVQTMSFTSSSSCIPPRRPIMMTTIEIVSPTVNRIMFSTWVELQSQETQLSDAEAKFIEVMLKCRDSK